MWTIALFELRARLGLLSTWLYFTLYGLLAGLWMAAAGGAIAGASVSFGSEKVFINSPFALAQAITILGFMGVTIVAAMMGRAVQQDFEHGTFHFFFTAPIKKRDYFFGRFIGAYLTLCLVFIGIALGLVVGSHWPGVDTAHVAPFSATALLKPYLFILMPNLLWLGGVFFVLAALTRQIAPVYIAGVVVLVGYLLGFNLLQDIENKTLAGLIDPIGSVPISILTRYWSVAEKNTQQLPLSGLLLWNRLIWLGFGVVVIALGYRRFQMIVASVGSVKSEKKSRNGSAPKPVSAGAVSAATPLRLDRRAGVYLRMLPPMVRLYLTETIKRPRFYIVVLAAVVFITVSASNLDNIYGTNTYALTYKVLEATSGLFALFILVITAINAGELIWRERDARCDEITDSCPVPAWLPFSAKLLTLFAIQALLLAVVMLCSIAIQLGHGYTRLEIGHYLFDLYLLQWPGYLILAAMAVTIHVLVNQKYLGHFLVVLFFVAVLKLPDYGFEDRLYLYGSVPDVVYSDMNGYGHFLPAIRWFQLYWGAAAVLLLLIANLLWPRGKDTSLTARLRDLRHRAGPASLVAASVAGLTFIASGIWIFHNTHQLNPFLSQYNRQQQRAEYEKRYKALALAPQPRIAAVTLNVDFYPHEHRTHIVGTYTLANKTTEPVRDLYINLPTTVTVKTFAADSPLTLADAEPALYWRHYQLATALAPGATMPLHFDLEYATHGFANDGASPLVLDNGTFLNAALSPETTVLPSLGYRESTELSADRERKKFGLAPKPRAHDLDDAHAQQSGLTSDGDWIHYSATLSTDADQMAMTSGDLDREWTEKGRRYFHYKMDTDMANVYSLQSARYAIRRDRWAGIDNKPVAIEIDYQPGHEWNLDRMVAGVKDSLDYFSNNFGPYQHHLVRILEFPRFSHTTAFAESFPNTIPFNEAIGFTAKVNDADPKDVDYPYFVTAHEVAHQWWAHQVMPADVEGGAFITESLAEYSALMVLKHKYGDAKMKRFFKYELDRYLSGRGMESKQELPLYRTDGVAYVHYRKGCLALYALQDAIGEDAVNRALAAFVAKWRFAGPPYATSRDLLAEFRAVTPAAQQPLIEDWFETITLYDNRATAGSYRELANGQYEVTLTVKARKLRADGGGAETEAALDQEIDIGVFDDKNLPLYLQKRNVTSGEHTLKMVVTGRPAKAGIDPLNKLIDRTPDDNSIVLEKQAAG